MRHTCFCVLGVVVAAMCWPQAALADGGKFPEKEIKEIAVMPAMPSQQAIIVYRDGHETLIVATSYETESETVGWVLPLPAEPTELAVAHGGMLDSLARGLQPKLVSKDDVAGGRRLMVGLAVLVVLPLSLIVMFTKARRYRVRALIVWAWCLLLIFLLWAQLATLGIRGQGAEAAGGAYAIELSSQRVGNYDVTVLKADESSALAGWLDANGFRSPDEKGQAIIDEYIADGWVFAVAKLRREGEGLATPHPIAATFPVAEPIYPMKLTALADTELHLELYVIADQQASCRLLRPVVADKFSPAEGREVFSVRDDRPRRYGYSYQPYFAGESTGIVGHPDVCELMWPGCVVTRLAGKLSPQQMDRDIPINLSEFSSVYQRKLFSAGAKREIMIATLAGGLAIALIALAVTCKLRRTATRMRMLVVAAALCGTAAGLGILHLVLPATPATTSKGLRGAVRFVDQLGLAEKAVEDGRLRADITDEELAQFPAIISADAGPGSSVDRNVFTGQPMEFERSAGNFHVRRIDGEVYLCLYDEFAREYRIKLGE